MKKKIKIIDLLCYISIGEYDELPEKFCFKGVTFKLNENKNYVSTTSGLSLAKYLDNDSLEIDLNAEIEIDEEILDEEDEFEDIEWVDVALLGQCDNWLIHQPTDTKQDIELNPYIINNIRENTLEFQHRINDLIKNQKKIIERLNNLDNN